MSSTSIMVGKTIIQSGFGNDCRDDMNEGQRNRRGQVNYEWEGN